MKEYDLLIIGGGPAGLAAGVYGARAKLKTAILEKGAVGGLAFTTREIVNYPGFKATTGPDLMKSMADHAKEFGAEIIKEQVLDIDLSKEMKTITTKKGNKYAARAVILAPGSQPRLLNIPGERRLRGSGVSYCATCDADFYQDLTVVIVGNGDAAIEEAVYITKYASKVIVIVIHDEGIVDCNKASAEKAFRNEKIEFVWNSVLTEIKGEEAVEGVVIKNLKTGNLTDLKTEGVFIYVGMIPETGLLKDKVDLDARGYIAANELMETSVDGVYAAGDARMKHLRQVVTAASDGAIAAVNAEKYLLEEDDFKDNVQNAKKPVVLAFWSPMDENSISALAKLEQAVAESAGRVGLVKVDISRKKRLAQRYNVTNIPAAMLLEDGTVIRDLSEELSVVSF
ncbi:MAG: thioredoxin reductase [Firmicutes bacterium]|nr:thioredoxin reductase [Bacillota bacterium]